MSCLDSIIGWNGGSQSNNHNPHSPMNRLSSRTHRAKKPDGFTLIELLTVIAIIGILAAILIPVVGRVRESAYSSKCVSNLRQLTLACHVHAEEMGYFPPSQVFRGTRQMNWIMILAESGYLQGTSRLEQDETIWFCPSAVRARAPGGGVRNSYGQNWQTGGWYMDPNRPEGGTASRPELVPEPSRTAMLMDGWWREENGGWSTYLGRLQNQRPDLVHPSSAVTPQGSTGKANVGFVDGHVRALSSAEVPMSVNDIFWRGSPSTSQSGGFF